MTHIFHYIAAPWVAVTIGICLSPATLAVLHSPTAAPGAAAVASVRNALDVAGEPRVCDADGAGIAGAHAVQVAVAPAHGLDHVGEYAADLGCHRMPELFRTVAGRIDEVYTLDATKLELFARIKKAACHFGVDPAIGKGIAWTESRFDQNARSPDGLSYGAFQLTRVTAEVMRARLARASVGLPLHDEVTLGIGYLRYLDRLFARRTVLDNRGLTTTPVTDPVERWRFAIASYNAGEGRVAGAQRSAAALGRNPIRFEDVRPFLPPITRRYVDTVITFGATQATVRADAAVVPDAVTS